MSLRLRLTLLYTTILAVLLVTFSAALYVVQTQVTLAALQATLADKASHMAETSPGDSSRLGVPPTFDTGDTLAQTRQLDGSLAYRSQQLGVAELPLPEAGLAAVAGGQSYVETATLLGEEYLVYSQPVRVDGRVVGVVQLAHTLGERNQALQALRRMLLVGCAAAVVVAGLAAWAAAGLALQPVNHLTGIAQAIGVNRDFGRRVEHTGPDDEIGRLATTFNSMLSELQAAHLSTEQALQAQRRFVADASHELRTPLTTLRGNLGLLCRRPPISETDRVEVLSDMTEEMERLIRLVNDLLSLARADAHQPLRAEPLALRPVLDDVVRQVRLLAPDRAVSCEAPDGLQVLGDRDAFKQVLLILLDNALKYTPSEARVLVSVAPADRQRVKLCVNDTGPGIQAEALAHLFDRFYRADTARTGPGTGLGLPIAKMLVEAQQGSICVESRLGEGTTFTVTLPRA